MSFFPLLYTWSFVTGRNEVVAKVIFLHLSVILFTGGCLPQCMLGYHTPPGADNPPPQSRHPPSRHHPKQTPTLEQTPPEQTPQGADTPPEQTPPWSRHPPGSRLQHTVNERSVRILLECILVVHRSTCYTGQFNSIVCRLSMRSTPECFCLR